MNKSELVNAISANSGLSKADAKKALDAALEAIAAELTKGEKVALLGFGNFSVSERPPARASTLQRKRKSKSPPRKS